LDCLQINAWFIANRNPQTGVFASAVSALFLIISTAINCSRDGFSVMQFTYSMHDFAS
jgi:hypothetical protein